MDASKVNEICRLMSEWNDLQQERHKWRKQYSKYRNARVCKRAKSNVKKYRMLLAELSGIHHSSWTTHYERKINEAEFTIRHYHGSKKLLKTPSRALLMLEKQALIERTQAELKIHTFTDTKSKRFNFLLKELKATVWRDANCYNRSLRVHNADGTITTFAKDMQEIAERGFIAQVDGKLETA